VYYS